MDEHEELMTGAIDQIEPDPRKGTLELARLAEMSFAGQRFRVFVDEVEVARLSNGKEVSMTVDPGEHTVKVKARLAFSGRAVVRVAAGEVVRLQCRHGFQTLHIKPIPGT